MSSADGSTKGSQSSSHSFGSRPPVRIPANGITSKPKQGLLQKKRADEKSESLTGKENIVNNSTNGK